MPVIGSPPRLSESTAQLARARARASGGTDRDRERHRLARSQSAAGRRTAAFAAVGRCLERQDVHDRPVRRGFTNPVLIDEEDGIIAGHGRVRAAHLLGLDEVPCIVHLHPHREASPTLQVGSLGPVVAMLQGVLKERGGPALVRKDELDGLRRMAVPVLTPEAARSGPSDDYGVPRRNGRGAHSSQAGTSAISRSFGRRACRARQVHRSCSCTLASAPLLRSRVAAARARNRLRPPPDSFGNAVGRRRWL
jgi:hypothetical protein